MQENLIKDLREQIDLMRSNHAADKVRHANDLRKLENDITRMNNELNAEQLITDHIRKENQSLGEKLKESDRRANDWQGQCAMRDSAMVEQNQLITDLNNQIAVLSNTVATLQAKLQTEERLSKYGHRVIKNIHRITGEALCPAEPT